MFDNPWAHKLFCMLLACASACAVELPGSDAAVDAGEEAMAADGGDVGVSSQALYESPCFRCDHVDPNTNGCTGAQTVREFVNRSTNIRVELRFSAACGGAWTRITQPGDNRYGTWMYLESKAGEGVLSIRRPIRHDSQEWTPMLDWARTLRACYRFGDDGEQECTSWW